MIRTGILCLGTVRTNVDSSYSDLTLNYCYNGRAERNRQHFEVAKIFREIDPRRGGGWVLIVMRGILICDIDRDKSGLRNMKNQNFEFPSAGTEKIITLPKAKIDQLPPISGKKKPFQKLGSRMDAPDIDLS